MQQARLIARGVAANTYFGATVSISEDRDTAIFRASGYDSNSGAAYVFVSTR